MLVNPDASLETMLTGAQNQRAHASAATANPSATPVANEAGDAVNAYSQLTPSLERLTTTTNEAQEAEAELQTEMEAEQTTQSVQQGIQQDPQTALAAQTNQLGDNVLGLLT